MSIKQRFSLCGKQIESIVKMPQLKTKLKCVWDCDKVNQLSLETFNTNNIAINRKYSNKD